MLESDKALWREKKARSEDEESVGVRARFLKAWSGKTSRGGTFEQRAEEIRSEPYLEEERSGRRTASAKTSRQEPVFRL